MPNRAHTRYIVRRTRNHVPNNNQSRMLICPFKRSLRILPFGLEGCISIFPLWCQRSPSATSDPGSGGGTVAHVCDGGRFPTPSTPDRHLGEYAYLIAAWARFPADCSMFLSRVCTGHQVERPCPCNEAVPFLVRWILGRWDSRPTVGHHLHRTPPIEKKNIHLGLERS